MVRFKNRWLLIEFLPVQDARESQESLSLSSKAVYGALKNSVVSNFGAAGWGAVGGSLNVKYFSPTTNVCIVRVGRDHHRIAWGAITLLTTLEGKRYIPHVVHVSGTIKKVQIAAIQHDRNVVARMRVKLLNPNARSDTYTAYLENSQKEIEAMQE